MKVVNWVFGSFFRTIGRTIAFLVMGGLVYYLLSYNGIEIRNLFFDRVDALALDGQINRLINVDNDSYNLTLGTATSRWWDFGTTFTTNNADDYIVFPFSGIIGYEQYNLSTDHYNFEANDIYLSISIISNIGGNNKACEIQNNMIVCPVNKGATYTAMNFEFWLGRTWVNSSPVINLKISQYPTLYKANSSAIIDSQKESTQAITNQTQQQQQQHQEMMESNTTQAESDASDFFGNFTQSDHGGLNSIVTAPLNTIRSLLTNSCTNLVLPLPFVNENITLPCMNDIYTTHFGLFFSLYQTIILAIISYRCIRSIFFDIHGFTDPDDDRIEVMDL